MIYHLLSNISYSLFILLFVNEIESLRLNPMPVIAIPLGTRRTTFITTEDRSSAGSDQKVADANMLREIVELRSNNLRATQLLPETDPMMSVRKNFRGMTPPPFVLNDASVKTAEDNKAYTCAQLQCAPTQGSGPVCACNFNTGHVVSFQNQCDVTKHNCRFNTAFKVILNEICPWQFESRRGASGHHFDYTNPSYYN